MIRQTTSAQTVEITLRAATSADVPTILRCIKALAE
jgi:hypothetical protein